MDKKRIAKSLMLTIRALGIEEEMRKELALPSVRPKKTFNGFEIYYNEKTGEAEGIVHNGIVHCKKTSSEKMSWRQAVKYCKTVIINGIQSELCPVDDAWRKEFKVIHKELYLALQEIGAENLNYGTWCVEYDDGNAWFLVFYNGGINEFGKYTNYCYVRPTLNLKRKA